MENASLSAAPALKNETAKGVTLLAAQILPVMAIVSLFPAIPKLMQQFGGIEHAALLVPMILTIPSLMVAIFAPVAGALADRFAALEIAVAGFGRGRRDPEAYHPVVAREFGRAHRGFGEGRTVGDVVVARAHEHHRVFG